MVSMHMKNIQIGGRTCHVHEFEDTVVLHSELETNMEIKYMCVGMQLNVFHASKRFV
jgi:hypothetical protein